MSEEDLLLCEVCDKGEPVGLAAVPGVPITVRYCRACINANAHPYGILVGNTAVASDDDTGMAEWWLEMVHATLRHLGKTEDDFWDDVAQSRRDMDEAMRLDAEQGGNRTAEWFPLQ